MLAAYLLGRSRIVKLVDPWVAEAEVTSSMLVYGEVIEYLRGKADYAQLRKDFRDLLREDFILYPLTYTIMERYADIRRTMRPPYGTGLIGDIDTVIAATARQNNLTVVTADSDFTRVPQLNVIRVERDWLKA